MNSHSRGMEGSSAIISSGVGLLHNKTSISLNGTPEPRRLRKWSHRSYLDNEKLLSWVAVNSSLKGNPVKIV